MANSNQHSIHIGLSIVILLVLWIIAGMIPPSFGFLGIVVGLLLILIGAFQGGGNNPKVLNSAPIQDEPSAAFDEINRVIHRTYQRELEDSIGNRTIPKIDLLPVGLFTLIATIAVSLIF